MTNDLQHSAQRSDQRSDQHSAQLVQLTSLNRDITNLAHALSAALEVPIGSLSNRGSMSSILFQLLYISEAFKANKPVSPDQAPTIEELQHLLMVEAV